jgi:formate-dependent nitrite reductase membrane component NrfD
MNDKRVELDLLNPLLNTKYTRPQEHWGWPISLDIWLAGMGAGSFVIGIMLDWLGYTAYPSNAVFLWGPFLVALAAPFLILDLGIKQRALNTCLNPRTSWLSRGFLIVSAFIIVGMATLGMSVLPVFEIRVGVDAFRIVEGAGFILALATAFYTGMLLKSTKYISLWSSWLLPALFFTASLCTGSMIVIMSALGSDILTDHHIGNSASEVLIHVQQVIIPLQALLLSLFLFFRFRNNEQGKRSLRLLLKGKLRFVFWIGIVVSAFILPLVLEGMYSPGLPFLPFLAGFFLLGGDFCLRLSIVRAGVKERPPLTNIIVIPHSLLPIKKIDDGSIYKPGVS